MTPFHKAAKFILKIAGIRIQPRQVSAVLVLLAVMMPITAPVPAWAYNLNLPPVIDDVTNPASPEPLFATSAMDFVENLFSGGGDKKKKINEKAAIKPVEKTEGKDVEEIPSVKAPVSEDLTTSVEKQKAEMESSESSAVVPSSKPIMAANRFTQVVNQLPADERESLYSAENNLGSPPGQTEMDSSNRAAALNIRHRAGAANFNFGIPLASLSGRGIDAGVGMAYNSRTWNKSCTQYDTQPPYGCTQNHFTYDVEQSWIAPGFSSGLGYLSSNFVTRNVVMMNGSNTVNQTLTEIVPEGIIEQDGTRRQIGCKTLSQIPGGHSSALYCSAYETSDGSFVRITRNGSNYSIGGTVNYANTYFTVTYSTGMKAYYGTPFGSGNSRKHFPYIIQDNNGNRIRIAYKSDQSGRIDYINDTLNRRIRFYYENDTSGNPDKLVAVTIPGMGVGEEIQTVRFYYEDMTLTSAGKFVGQITAPPTIRVLRWVYMPATKTAYKYDYHPNYGMIKKIERRVGVVVSSPTSTTSTGTVDNEGAWAATTEYDFPTGSTALDDVPKYTKRSDDWKDPNNLPAAETFYDFPEDPGLDSISRITVKDNGFDVRTENISAPDGMIRETSVTKIFGPALQYTQLMFKNEFTWTLRNLTKLETTNEALLKKKTEFEYDQYNNQKSVKEYDYNPTSGSAALLRTTVTAYETGAGWINANLLGLAKSVETIVGGVTVAKSLIEYDHNGSDATITVRGDIYATGTHDSFFNPGQPAWTETICPNGATYNGAAPESEGDGCVTIYHPGYSSASAYRGNVTKVGRMLDVNATTITTTNADITDYNHDIAGNVVSATLSCCQLKTLDYGASFGVTGYAYPVKETKGTSPQLISEVGYNRNTGLITSSKDENGEITDYEYETDTLRPKKTIYPNDGYTETFYSDKEIVTATDLVPGYVRQKTTLEASKFAESYSYFDGRGLGLRSATKTPDGWSISAADYDSLGRMKKSYNPFYGSTPTTAVPTGTKFTEITAIDAFGRTTGVKFQDDTTVSTAFSDQSTTPTGFNKTFVTITDQAGKKRRQVMDSLGRLVRADEPDAAGNLGAVDATLPLQQTSYEYDGNDNLAKVIQTDTTMTPAVTQERKFKYDSLSRMTHEKQVEANATLDVNGVKGPIDPVNKWTKYLKYNIDGLLHYGVDARGVKTSFVYDGLNRVKNVNYSDETGYTTPNVTYTYDQARTGFYNNGALTKVDTPATTTNPEISTEFDYDLMGRVVKHRQTIGAQQYNLEYGYNLAGQLTSEKYPSGKIVTTNYDANGRLSGVADPSRTYLSGMQYLGKGNSLSSMSLGNSTTETFTLNDRFQMTEQELKRGAEVLQKYNYGYGDLDSQGVLKNNGKLESVVSHIGTNKQSTQKFLYDHVGRLKESAEYRGDNNSLTYKQVFNFDRFGNLYRKAASNPPAGQANPLIYTPIEETTTPGTGDIEKSTNRFRTGTTYDDAGQVVNDTKFRSMGFSYDANGRQVKATRAGVPDAWTVYDAGGNRVATKINDVWQYMVYNAFGKLVAEYGVASEGVGGVKYVQQDWQGSVRTVTNNNGFVVARTDHQAFGGEVGYGTGQRSVEQGYNVDKIARQGYGLTERDDATGQDHTWFRKNENMAGRWTSPDPYSGSMNLGDPQSFNRYSYVQSQPTNFVDPSGLLLVEQCRKVWWYDSAGYYHSYLTACVTIYDDGGGGGGATSQQTQNPKAKARDQLANFLKFKAKQCADALKALGLTDRSILSGFDSNNFYNGGPSDDSATTNWYANGTSDTTTQNGVVDFITNNQPMGWLIHEVGVHAVRRITDSQAYNRLLIAQRAGNISGLAVLATVTDGPNGTASPAISRYLNSVCKDTIQDSPLPSGGNNQGSSSV